MVKKNYMFTTSKIDRIKRTFTSKLQKKGNSCQ